MKPGRRIQRPLMRLLCIQLWLMQLLLLVLSLPVLPRVLQTLLLLPVLLPVHRLPMLCIQLLPLLLLQIRLRRCCCGDSGMRRGSSGFARGPSWTWGPRWK